MVKVTSHMVCTKFVGFQTLDRSNYGAYAPCSGIEGASGGALSSRQRDAVTSKPSAGSVYPGQFVFTLKLDERFGSCYTAHDAGFVRTASYDNQLMPNNGLNFSLCGPLLIVCFYVLDRRSF